MYEQQNFIGTWIYLDTPEESSKFPNNKGKSSSSSFQAVYWRCVIVFFETSLRFHSNNDTIKHILFTNSQDIPEVDGMNLKKYFDENQIEVVVLKNNYPLPNDYFSSFRNQFFEFSIIEHMAKKMTENQNFLLLDSDCVFTKKIDEKFEPLAGRSAITLDVGYGIDANIHGITRVQMKEIFKKLGLDLNEPPMYSGGEFLMANSNFIKNVAKDFPNLFQWLLDRNKNKLPKFNEEAHVLSYYYHLHEAQLGGANTFAKRMWTNRNHYRNIKHEDETLSIWHMPNEKPMGFANTFKFINSGQSLRYMNDNEFHQFMIQHFLRASNHKLDLPRYVKSKIEHWLN